MNTLRQFSLAIALCGAAGLAVTQSAHAQTNYVFTNFDGPGVSFATTINGISSNGIEVGFTQNAAGAFTNFLRDPNGAFTLLNTLNNQFPTTGQANGVNASRTVVGTDGFGNAISLSGAALTNLPPVLPAIGIQTAFGINDAGAIVGQFAEGSGNMPGFARSSGGAYTILNPTNTAIVTNAQGINNKGLVTGFYSTGGMQQFGFLYDTVTGLYTLLPDPSTPRITADGLALTQFLGINDNNEAVGYYQTNNGSQFGFTFDIATDTYTYLDDPLAALAGGVQITQITGVDNKGDLSGFFLDANGVQHGFFAAAVPEPGAYALLVGLGLSGVTLLARHRSKGHSQ